MPADVPHVLVIRRRYLGDIVLLGSLCRNLKLHWPRARIAVLCEPAYADVLTMNADVDEVFHFPAGTTRWPRLIGRLRRARFTHVLDLDNRDKTAFLSRATGAPVRVTQRHAEKVHFPSLYTASERLPAAFLDHRHITDLYLHLLGNIGVPIASREVRLTPRTEDLALAQNLFSRLFPAGRPAGTPLILIHPGSRSPWRVWPPESFGEVISQLIRRRAARVAIVAGPGDQTVVAQIQRHADPGLPVVDQALSLPQLAALFASCDALLCHDSGPMHLAAAVGTRVIALFGSQPLHLWRPVGEKHVTLQPPLPCAQCASPGLCQPHDSYHNHCVRNITVQRVYEAISQALA